MGLHTLGSLHLVGHRFHRPKPLLLLAYLALEGPKARRYIAELFFMDTKDPLNSLSRSISYLREESPELIEGDSQQVATSVTCDAVELLELANAQAFERCRELYQGAFAEYVNFTLSEELEDWLYKTREHIAKRMRDVFLQLAEGRMAQGNLAEAATLAERAYTLAGAPELEPDDFVRLHQLLGVTNSPRVVDLRREAQEYAIALESPKTNELPSTAVPKETIPNNLPAPKSSFVGRNKELAMLAAHLSQPECRLLTIHGMGGIGKSRLALRYAHQALEDKTFRDGIFFVELDRLQNADGIPATIAAALDLKIQDPSKALEVVTEFVGRQQMVLVFDNFETVITGATLASKLLEVCPELKLLVTSRERLNVEAEWVLSIEGLPLTLKSDDGLTEAEPSDAELLFMLRAKRAKLDLTMTPEVVSVVRDICRLVEGSPLGIELAAAWVKSLPVAEIFTELQSNLDLLRSTLRDAPERHTSIRAVFEQSWQHLSAKEHSVLQKLSVFVDGFSREAASLVADATIPLLSSLQEKSWLRVTDKGRYTRHPLIYQFTKEKFSDQEVRNEVCEKHAKYYAEFMTHRWQEEYGPHHKEIIDAIEVELDNVRAAWPYLLSNIRIEQIDQVRKGLWRYYRYRGSGQAAIDMLIQAVPVLEGKPGQAQMVLTGVLNDLAQDHLRIGKLRQAKALAEQSLVLSRTHDFPTVRPLSTLGAIASDLGDYAEAKHYYEEALAIERTENNRIGEAIDLYNLAGVIQSLGDYAQAEKLYLESVAIDRELENLEGTSSDLQGLGAVYLDMNELEKAEAAFRESLEIAHAIDFRHSVPRALNGLGKVAFERREYQTARAYFEEALGILAENPDAELSERLLINLARVATHTGNFSASESYLKQALSLAQPSETIPNLLHGLTAFAELSISKAQVKQGVTLVSFLNRCPAIDRQDRDEGLKLLEKAKGQLSERDFTEAQEASKTLTLEGILFIYSEKFIREAD